MIGQTVIFDGHRLNDRFFVGDVSCGLPEFVPRAHERVGDGSHVGGMRVGTATIAVTLVAKPVRGEPTRAAISALLSWLDVEGPRRLSLSEDGGLWRMAVPNGAPEVVDIEYNDVITVEFMQTEPWLYGSERSVTIPSGGNARFLVGGDAPTMPTVSAASVTRDDGTLRWGVRLDGGDVLRVGIPVASASSVLIDCPSRKCSVNGATTAISLESDWLVLKPGTHVIQNDLGAGACEVAWLERWHR